MKLVPDDDGYIILRIDRIMLGLLLLVLMFLAGSLTFGITQSIKSDDDLARETKLTNEVSEASVEFWRCAFLIEPDVEKTPAVIDACIKQARFPDR